MKNVRKFVKNEKRQRNGQNGVKTIQYTAMSRKDLSEILDTVVTLYRRHRKISNLRYYGNDNTISKQCCKIHSFSIFEKVADKNAIENKRASAEKNTAYASLDGLFGIISAIIDI